MPKEVSESKTAKELAYLHDLYVAADWSERFANLVDENIKLPKDGQFLYVEAGTGNHALELREKLDDKVEFYLTESDAERFSITRAKATAVGAEVHPQNSYPHQLNFPAATFGTVVCDASFLPVERLLAVWQELYRVLEKKGDAALVLPTAGSFGDFFSTFWEALYALEMTELGAEVEKLITDLPTVSDVEDTARNAGFADVEANTKIEIFEYENGGEFLRSPLIANFLLPLWTNFVAPKKQVKLLREIERAINEAHDDISFHLTVKMTLITAHKK